MPPAYPRLPALSRLTTLGLALASSLTAAPADAQTQDLFVANQHGSTISRFAGTGPGTFSTNPTVISGGLNQPEGLAFDGQGDLFVANNLDGTLAEFAAGTTPGALDGATTVRTGLSQPQGIAFDARGDLFVGNFGSDTIIELRAGAAPGTFGTSTTLTPGYLNGPEGLALDALGNLYAASYVGTVSPINDTITRFQYNPTSDVFTYGMIAENGQNRVQGLAFDAAGDLFAANAGTNSISEFMAGATPGTLGTSTVFTGGGLNYPRGIAMDAEGDLFVANTVGNTITEFAFDPATKTFGAGTVVERGLSSPSFIAFGPSAPVPTAYSQSVTTGQDAPAAVLLSGNDTNSPPLSLTYAVSVLPLHGTLTGTAPNLTYTPAAGYSGPDSLTFSASDGVETSASATVVIQVLTLSSLAFVSPVPGGTVLTATVTLSAAGTSDTVVGTASSDPSVVRVPPALVIPAGSSGATFLIATFRSHTTKAVTITATLGSAVRTVPLTITGR